MATTTSPPTKDEFPSKDEFDKITQVQVQREHEIRQSRLSPHDSSRPSLPDGGPDDGPDEDRAQAARMIQKTYRGYRARREFESFNLDASRRWVAAVREARFRHETRPLPPGPAQGSEEGDDGIGEDAQEGAQEHDQGPSEPHATVRTKWKRATAIARRANFDPRDSLSDSSSISSSSSSASLSRPLGPSTTDRAKRRRIKAQEDAHRRQEALMMKMDYFLEMVDLKHRYGSNLRAYHAVWKDADTRENFFYWLDHGEGRNMELEGVPRERLEREQVRYLSRDERQYYLVKVDAEGRLCWAKNGERIDTTTEYRDSVRGIVPVDDPTPAFVPPSHVGALDGDMQRSRRTGSHGSTTSSFTSSSGSSLSDAAARYPAPDLDQARGFQKLNHVSVSTILNRLLRRTVRKNTWIFVADTRFRLYVSIKESGAFQHSSFLQGSRISAAGLIRISDGRLRSLSPLSGHYRPPASSFRAFVSSLRAAGVDMSRVSISKSYVVLLGLEAYVKTRQRGKRAKKEAGKVAEKVAHPDKARRREEDERDKSESAEKERRAMVRAAEAEGGGGTGAARLMSRLGLAGQGEAQ